MPLPIFSWGSIHRPRAASRSYAVALLIVVLAFICEWTFWHFLAPTPTTLIVLASIVSLLYGGIGPAIVTLVSSWLLVDYFFIQPTNTLTGNSFIRLSMLLTALLVVSALERAYWRERRLREASDHLIHMVSHDLKTPLTAAMFAAGILAKRIPVEHHKYLERIDRALRRQQRLLERVLDTATLMAEHVTLHKEKIRLDELVMSVVDDMNFEFERQNVNIKVKTEPVVIYGDYTRLEEVIANLLSNALKYGGNQPVEVAVCLRDGIRIVVKDSGPGIPESELEAIFNKFERGAHTYKQTGHGLGLWITKRLVEMHDGRIVAQHSDGGGTEFVVYLPDGHTEIEPAPEPPGPTVN